MHVILSECIYTVAIIHSSSSLLVGHKAAFSVKLKKYCVAP